MAKETTSQRRVREALEEAAHLEQVKTEYLPALMDTLCRASFHGMELSASNGHFHVRRPGEGDSWAFPPKYNTVASNLLWELNFELNLKEQEDLENERRYQVRKSALAKLTKEEKEILGV